jgi:hypothetical protein
MGRLSSMAVAASLVVLATGCTSATDRADVTPPTSSSSSPSERPSPSASASPALEDGRYYGAIKSAHVTAEPRSLVFDLEVFLTGEAANKAAAERGDETPVPNDVYIINDNPRLRTLAVSPAVRIVLVNWLNCCDHPILGDRAKFEDAFSLKRFPANSNYKGKFSGYWLTIRNGAVVKVEEQYLP